MKKHPLGRMGCFFTDSEVQKGIETGRIVFRAAASDRALRRRHCRLAGKRPHGRNAEVRILSCTDDGSGTLLLTVAVTKEGYGFSRFEARTQNGVTLVQVYGRRDGEAAGTLTLAGAADTNVLLTGEEGGTIVYEASGE